MWSTMESGSVFRSTSPPSPLATRLPSSSTSKRFGPRLRRSALVLPLPPLLNWEFWAAPAEGSVCSTSPMELRPLALIWALVTMVMGRAASTSVRLMRVPVTSILPMSAVPGAGGGVWSPSWASAPATGRSPAAPAARRVRMRMVSVRGRFCMAGSPSGRCCSEAKYYF